MAHQTKIKKVILRRKFVLVMNVYQKNAVILNHHFQTILSVKILQIFVYPIIEIFLNLKRNSVKNRTVKLKIVVIKYQPVLLQKTMKKPVFFVMNQKSRKKISMILNVKVHCVKLLIAVIRNNFVKTVILLKKNVQIYLTMRCVLVRVVKRMNAV